MLKFKTRKIPLSEIKIPARFVKTSPAPKKISRRYEVYHKYGIFDRAIIIDQDNTLLDGYTAYLVAKMMGVEVLEVVRVSGIEPVREISEPSRTPAEVKLPDPKPSQEPVKLYCVNGIKSCFSLTRGKVYEFIPGGGFPYDNKPGPGDWPTYEMWANGNVTYSKCLFPLVSRPAMPGEWVYVMSGKEHRYEPNKIYRVSYAWGDGCVSFAWDGNGNVKLDNYLVLDGYSPEIGG